MELESVWTSGGEKRRRRGRRRVAAEDQRRRGYWDGWIPVELKAA